MTTTIVRPDSATAGTVIRNNASDMASSTAIDLLVGQADREAEPLLSAHASASVLPEANTRMTEDDTVSVLDVLAEMQRIIDRHIEKTEKHQGDR